MNFLFRVDASYQIGTGHLVRCLTLAKKLRDRGANCYFVSRPLDGSFLERIRKENFELFPLQQESFNIKKKTNEKSQMYSKWFNGCWERDAEQTIAIVENIHPNWLIVDSYALDARWGSALRPYCDRLLVIDDLADRDYECDLLLDQNLLFDMSGRYVERVPARCSLMLGPNYALLQSQYKDLHPITIPRRGGVKRILVFVGGSDMHNLTGLIINAYLSLKQLEVSLDVVIDSKNPYINEIRQKTNDYPSITLHENLPSLADLILKADLAIGAAGGSSWERCCLGLPSIVITVAENQVPIASELNRGGYILWLGHYDVVSESIIATALQGVLEMDCIFEWSSRCMGLVDGLGADRVASILLLNSETNLQARFAKLEDEGLLLDWVNDPLVRNNAFDVSAIHADTHCGWFRKRLQNFESSIIFIIETEVEFPIGVVRFEKVDQAWEIHYSLSPLARNRGIGGKMLKTGMDAFSRINPNESLFGRVKVENKVSQRIFNQLGFEEFKSDFLITYRISKEVV